jgi:hypothetical protein
MNSVLDALLVGLALLASAGYALLSLGPSSLRRRLLAGLSRLTARAPAFFGLRRAAQWLAAAAAGKAHGACGGCDDCGSEKTPATAATTHQSPVVEIRVPVTKISRRESLREGESLRES